MKAQVRKLLIGLVGGLVLLIGVALLILPGPAFLVIPAGLAILATEFLWARRCKDYCTKRVQAVCERRRARKQRTEAYSS